MNLSEIVEKMDELMESQVDENGELIFANQDYFAELAENFVEKVEGCVFALRKAEGNAEMLKKWRDDTDKRMKQEERKAEWLKAYLTFCLKETPFQSEKAKISFRKSESVFVLDETKIPKDFMVETVKVAPDKRKIKEALKSGELIDGVTLKEEKKIQIK